MADSDGAGRRSSDDGDDGQRLKRELRQADRREKRRAIGLLLPAFLLIAVTFLAPISLYLYRAVDNAIMPELMPLTTAALAAWDGAELPPDAAYDALLADLTAGKETQSLGRLARRLNYSRTGFRELVLGTAKKLNAAAERPAREALIEIDPRWGENPWWATIKQESGAITPFYLLASLDLRIAPSGDLVRVKPEQALYVSLFIRTFWISACVTALCFLLGYPTAYALSILPSRITNLLMILVMIPFWTSILVRTTAWAIMLQETGPVNGVLRWAGIISEPLPLMFNRAGVLIAMTHVLLPFFILPLYGVMKGIPASQTRAASSLGAHPILTFCKIYFPQTMPGVAAGALLVFILALGYYITPAIVGGQNDQMISYFIALFTNQTINWGQAAALGTWLLVSTFILFALYSRLVGLGKMRLA